MNYAWLAQEIERERQRDLRAQARLRREYEQQGIDYSMIQEAQRGAFREAMRQIEEQRRIPTQLELPGVAPPVLDRLRYRDQLSPQESAAAGLFGVGWQETPRYPGRQMELGEAVPTNNVRGLNRPDIAVVVEEMAKAEAPRSRSGMRMAMRWGLPALGGVLGLYALAETGGGEQQQQVAAQ